MEIHCPNGYTYKGGYIKEKGGFGSMQMPVLVIILEGTCSHADLCGKDSCQYNDQSEEATKRWMRRMRMMYDLTTGAEEEEELKSILYEKFHSSEEVYRRLLTPTKSLQ